MDSDPAVHLPAAKAFMLYDSICSTHLPSQEIIDEVLNNNDLTLSIAKAFIYYSYHRFFLEPNQILSNIQKIAHLPAIIVHGRWDAICLPEMAYLLHKKWANSVLWFVEDGGHSSSDPTISQALVNATNLFKELLKNSKEF